MNKRLSLKQLFDNQAELQKSLGLCVGSENVVQWYNALTAAMLEIGEALSEDTRWKILLNGNVKPQCVNRENVIEETADVFIYLINACIFYNIGANDLINAIAIKQEKNIRRLTTCLKK